LLTPSFTTTCRFIPAREEAKTMKKHRRSNARPVPENDEDIALDKLRSYRTGANQLEDQLLVTGPSN